MSRRDAAVVNAALTVLAAAVSYAAGMFTGCGNAIREEYEECVQEKGAGIPEHSESCGSRIGAEHGEQWRKEWP